MACSILPDESCPKSPTLAATLSPVRCFYKDYKASASPSLISYSHPSKLSFSHPSDQYFVWRSPIYKSPPASTREIRSIFRLEILMANWQSEIEAEVQSQQHPPVINSSTCPTIVDSSSPAITSSPVVNNMEPVENERDEEPFKKKKRKKTSLVWKEFETVVMSDKTNKAECVHCKAKLSILQSRVTSHLTRHLNSCLSRKLAQKKQKTLQLQPVDSQVESPFFSSGTGKYDEGKQREAIAHWILMHEKPFSIIAEEGFNFMMGINLPMWDRISRNAAKSDCISVYEIEKKKLRTLLTKINKVSLTTDIWKSAVQKKSYIYVLRGTSLIQNGNFRNVSSVLLIFHLHMEA
ncbi:uncharacterized protein LOC120009801 [Tripterygium wilfordii]|uniref:uncharacterized protein LOC120009801 n=1 Tax=Tripterygium wilfordii TaxID=458696 RepID=UPI0018F8138C|nr:uncharacterized protein LOC120009801 [Tripterygium wilfordii]